MPKSLISEILATIVSDFGFHSAIVEQLLPPKSQNFLISAALNHSVIGLTIGRDLECVGIQFNFIKVLVLITHFLILHLGKG